MNFIYFNPDELRANVLGCYGHPLAKTPNFDRLAASGVRFDQCHVQHTVCTPSRCSFMTGWYPHTRGHRTLWHALRPDEPNTLRYLKEAGYDVHWIGKNDLLAPGAFAASTTAVHDWTGPDTDEEVFPAGHPHHRSFLRGPMRREPADAMIVEQAIAFLRRRRPGDPPFMLYLPLLFPHAPYTAPEPWYSLYRPEDVPPLRPADLAGKPGFHRLIRRYRQLDRLDDLELRRVMAVYLGMVSYTDHLLGRLLDALDATGLAASTAVFAFSDHGDWAGDYGLVEKWSNALDDCLTRIPMIVRVPGLAAGHVVAEPVECFDIVPTTLELAGVTVRHTHAARSMLPQLRGAAGDRDRATFAEGGYDVGEPHCFEGRPGHDLRDLVGNVYYPKALQQQRDPESICRSVMVRTRTHKLIRRTNGEHELYDLAADPDELRNRYGDPALAGIQAALGERLLDWYLRTSDAVPHDADPRGFPKEILRTFT